MKSVTDHRLSKLINAMLTRPSAIRSMMKLADERNIRKMGLDPKDVISFGGGWVGHHAPDRLREIYAEICLDREKFHCASGYPPIPGIPECRRALAHMDEFLFGVKASEANIHVGASSTELTYDLLRILADPHDNILLLDPTYVNYHGQLVLALTNWTENQSCNNDEFHVPDARIIHLRVFDPVSWEYLPDVDYAIAELERIFKIHKPKVLMLASPDNPTGQIIPHKFMKAALEICENNGSYLVIDYAYKWQYFVETLPEYFSWSPEEYENLVLIYSASKWSRALGRRLGWICAPRKIVEAMETMLAYSILCGDHFHQLAMAIYLEESIADRSLKAYVDMWNEKYKNAAKVTVETIDEYCGCRRLVPQGALYTVMDLGNTAEPLVHEILKNTGVLFIPGIGFGKSLINGVRVSYGPLVEKPEKIKEGLRRTGEYLSSRKKK